MFMELAIGAVALGIVVMIGYIIISEVQAAIPTPQAQYTNSCLGHLLNDTTFCNTTDVTCGPISDNTSAFVTCDNAGYVTGTASAQSTIFAGFGLIAVGVIVLAAFGLINVFK